MDDAISESGTDRWGGELPGLDFALREITLFAACGFLLLGTSDLAVDFIWLVRAVRRRLTRRGPVQQIAAPGVRGHLAVFIPAWDEAAVIGKMLRHAITTFDHPDYRLYVGCYPNDPETIAQVRAVRDPRVRLVIGPLGIM
jgi:adsorption protein B